MESELCCNQKCTQANQLKPHFDGEHFRIPALRPRLWSVLGNLFFSVLLLLLAFATGFLWCTDTLGPDSNLILIITATALMTGLVFGSNAVHLFKRWQNPGKYCLILTSDRILEYSGTRRTSIPRERLIAAWDKGGRSGGVALVYRNQQDKEDIWVAHNPYPIGKTLPSPAIRRIQSVYGIPDPAQTDEY